MKRSRAELRSAPSRTIALLRAINVGGHRVKMDELRRIFEGLGLEQVETFIASGNVAFAAGRGKPAGLERTIERELHSRLGYEVKTFLRTVAELEAVAAAAPFGAELMARAKAHNVGFLGAPLDAEGLAALDSLRTGVDDFAAIGREIHWLCSVRQSDSTFSNHRLERLLGTAATFRGIGTVRRMVARYGSAPAMD